MRRGRSRVFKTACTWSLAGALLTSVVPAATASLEGGPAPDFVLKSQDGSNVRLSEFRGQVVLVNFWARYADESREEMAELDRIDGTYRSAGLVVLGVSVDEDAGRAREFVKSRKTGYPMLFETGPTLGQRYHLQKMPMTVLVDRSGTVRHSHVGFKRGDERAYVDEIRELLRE